MNASVISIEKLSHRYHRQWAIKDISITVEKTGIYGLLGANGAGKSTLMNILCGVIAPTSGMVQIKGVNIRLQPIEAKKHIGFLPQNPPLLKELTIREYLGFAADLRFIPASKRAAMIEAAMEKCHLTHYQNRLIKNLSGGFQQRVGIAQAIIHEPAFVVLDEPTNGLDPVQILEIRKLIKEIAQERTVILSTHILQEVQALCDTIWLLKNGKLIFSGTVDEFEGNLNSAVYDTVWLRNPDPAQIKMLTGIVNVEQVEKDAFKIYTDGTTAALETLVTASVRENWGLVQLSPEKRSLETAFSQYTHSD